MSKDQALLAEIENEVKRRRTFAIISHPDAGKTTLTEKLLLYSGMIRTAGMVSGRKNSKSAASDWMSMEQERGISITASAMQFNYKNTVINVLDTPGHEDFCADTYRTLTAADCVIMVIDAAKGVENQTIKLFEACRLRGIPVITFVNKMDLPARDPIDLMEEVENVLGIQSTAKTWPIGNGRDFRGVVNIEHQTAHLFTKMASGGSLKPEVEEVPLPELKHCNELSEQQCQQVLEEIELMQEAGNIFELDSFREGKITPVYFGSAMTNFGIEILFDDFIRFAPIPSERPAQKNGEHIKVHPTSGQFSAYIFKLQANMNPRHRDCVAFMRINSGRYEKDLGVKHDRLGRKIRLSRPHTLMVSDRNNIDHAYPGDIIGVINPGLFNIGDTISMQGGIEFEALPQFQPELFKRIQPKDLGKRKAIDKGLKQLVAEGAVQLLFDYENAEGPPFIAAVGRLQFDVLSYRLKEEYGVETMLTDMPFECSAWIKGDPETFKKPYHAKLCLDERKRVMVLFSSEWEKRHAAKENPDHELLDFY